MSLAEARNTLKEAYQKRKTLLEQGSGSFAEWRAPDSVKDEEAAIESAKKDISAQLAEKDHANMPLAYKQANLKLVLSRDLNRLREDRIMRAAAYLSMLDMDIEGTPDRLSIKLPDPPK